MKNNYLYIFLFGQITGLSYQDIPCPFAPLKHMNIIEGVMSPLLGPPFWAIAEIC